MVIKDKNGKCSVHETTKGKTPKTIAGPFATKELAEAAKAKECPPKAEKPEKKKEMPPPGEEVASVLFGVYNRFAGTGPWRVSRSRPSSVSKAESSVRNR